MILDLNNIYSTFNFLHTSKKVSYKIYLSYQSIQLSTLNCNAQLETNEILHIVKLRIIVYQLTNNNYYYLLACHVIMNVYL